ncbi:hypothetical protein OE88DRAFT_1633813 [Heliocybe sulcata]|uniref:Glycosyltransferase family 32 protein n=1 Tax=Heliocybe sulcata TaxID=5364 RepID=A0A5C3MYA2_9AGAM|nr:hypothetical protein OE88DRAFT_1633813 [Heliocybe sulcata]
MYDFSPSSARRRSPVSSHVVWPPPRSPSPSRTAPRPRWSRSSRTLKSALRVRPLWLVTVIALAAVIVIFGLTVYQPYIEIQFHSREWIRQHITPELSKGAPPKCFTSGLSPSYNITEGLYGKRRWEVQSGTGMQLGRDCYEFAGTLGKGGLGLGPTDTYTEVTERKVYHTYWRTDLTPFGDRQAHMLRSFFATQPRSASKLILWSNGDLLPNPILSNFLSRYPESFELRVVNIPDLAKGTPLEGTDYVSGSGVNDKKAWVDGDLIRLLVVWNDGGIWVDMDMLLTRSLDPLWEHEFVIQWDCYDKPLQPFNGALLSFHKHSPYLCLMFEIMKISPAPTPASTDWGSLLYLKAYRTLLHLSIPPFRILPWCFIDGASCRLDNRLPDPFIPDIPSSRRSGDLDRVLGMVFGVHLHNRWEKQFPKDGWVDRLVLRKYDRVLGRRGEDDIEES